MRVAEDDPRAHRHELVGEEQPVLEHLLEQEHRAPRLGGHSEGDRGAVGREGGPGPILDLRNVPTDVVLDVQLLAGRDAYGSVSELDTHTEPRKRREDRDEILGLHAIDGQIPARDGSEPDEAGDLDVVGPDRPLTTAEAVDALDSEHVRLDAL